MLSVSDSVHARGGLAATFELHADGHSRHAIAAAVRAARVIRVRQGWFSARDLHPLLQQAVRVGGRLTCVSALPLHGVWSFSPGDLHVTVPANGCRLRTPDDMRKRLGQTGPPNVRVHWREDDSPSRLLLSPLSCLTDVLECVPAEFATASADSLLREHPDVRPHWPAWLDARPANERRWLALADGICESGTETVVWYRMRDFRLAIRRQVHIGGVGRVDFLVGDRLVVEVDGAAYHTDPVRFEADRHRDALLSHLGYRVLRFSYHQVMYLWPEVEAAILAAVIRGDHH
jgi:very-short-patch-repair endonuclease